MGVGVVVLQGEVGVFEVENALHVGIYHHAGQRTRGASELQVNLVYVVVVYMGIAKGVDELAGLQSGHLRHHHSQQGVGGDVERHAKEGVGAALVKLQRKFTLSHIELEEGMAGGKVHVVEVGHVPCAHNDAARIGVVLDVVDRLRNLVDEAAVVARPRTPLIAVDVTQAAVGVGPFVPYAHAVLLKVGHIGVAAQEPQQFVDYRFEMELFGGEQGESVGEVESHLVAEHASGSGSGAVGFLDSVFEDVLQKVEILLHMGFCKVLHDSVAEGRGFTGCMSGIDSFLWRQV